MKVVKILEHEDLNLIFAHEEVIESAKKTEREQRWREYYANHCFYYASFPLINKGLQKYYSFSQD